MDNFIVLDLETPNRYSNSMSSIGIVVVENDEVVDEIYSLINPEAPFEPFNIALTGIHPEDVEDAPTFKEFYPNIKGLLSNNVIVGQNITFDLSVISKSLTHYNMPLPPFKYYCTLSSCKRNLHLYDNSLSYIVPNVLKTTYNAHNAMADAQMTYKLYNYLGHYEKSRNQFLKTFYYRPKHKRDFNRTFDYNYNYLYGLIKKFNYIDEVSDNHNKLFKTWYESNKYENSHPLIENILLKVSYIVENNLNCNQIRQISESLKAIKRSPEYKVINLKLQVLRGLVDSITCEDEISPKDIEFLTNWINEFKINDKTVNNKLKKINWDDKSNLIEELTNFSKFLQDYT